MPDVTDKVSQISVLLIDDDPMDLELYSGWLAESNLADFQTSVASSLGDAKTTLRSTPIDAAVLDLGLPDSSGFETFSSLRELFEDLPIVVLTGIDDDGIAARAVGSGAQDFLSKKDADARLLPRALQFAIERHSHRARRLLELACNLAAKSELLRLCSYCRKIHDPDIGWQSFEIFALERLQLAVSHGICENCDPKARQMMGLESKS